MSDECVTPALFELSPPSPDARVGPTGPKQLQAMQRKFGPGPAGVTCGGCAHFFGKQYAKTYFKCRIYGNSGGAATDWRKSWPACGKFQERS